MLEANTVHSNSHECHANTFGCEGGWWCQWHKQHFPSTTLLPSGCKGRQCPCLCHWGNIFLIFFASKFILNNQTTQISGNIFSSLKRKDSISVAIDKNSVLCCPVGTFNISKSPHFLVLKNTFRPTGRPCHGILSFPKKSGIFT